MAPRSKITKKHGREVVAAQSMVEIRKYGRLFVPVLFRDKIIKLPDFLEKSRFFMKIQAFSWKFMMKPFL